MDRTRKHVRSGSVAHALICAALLSEDDMHPHVRGRSWNRKSINLGHLYFARLGLHGTCKFCMHVRQEFLCSLTTGAQY